MKSFFQNVWALVAKIPRGRVASYGQIAYMLGNARAARTVGWALYGMPDGLDIPWHRVINAGGRVSTDCGEHDPGLQRLLLEGEGIEFVNGRVDMGRFQWRPEVDDLDLWMD